MTATCWCSVMDPRKSRGQLCSLYSVFEQSDTNISSPPPPPRPGFRHSSNAAELLHTAVRTLQLVDTGKIAMLVELLPFPLFNMVYLLPAPSFQAVHTARIVCHAHEVKGKDNLGI